MDSTKAKPHGLDALIGLAQIHAGESNFDSALELLALVQNDPGSDWEIREKARKLHSELIANMTSQEIDRAMANGRNLDLWETASLLVNTGVTA